MPTATETKQFSNISATTAGFALRGGRYVLNVSATFGGGSVALQQLSLDGATWVPPMNIAGVANNFTAAGSQALDLPPGTYRLIITTATAVYASLSAVPS